MTNFCKNLKYFRKKRGIRQVDLGKILGVRQTTISGWEIGRAEPNIEQLIQLSSILQVCVDRLIKEEL